LQLRVGIVCLIIDQTDDTEDFSSCYAITTGHLVR